MSFPVASCQLPEQLEHPDIPTSRYPNSLPSAAAADVINLWTTHTKSREASCTLQSYRSKWDFLQSFAQSKFISRIEVIPLLSDLCDMHVPLIWNADSKEQPEVARILILSWQRKVVKTYETSRSSIKIMDVVVNGMRKFVCASKIQDILSRISYIRAREKIGKA